ncbi:MAG: hypothetical protein WC837_04530 [Bellilinea sp.]
MISDDMQAALNRGQEKIKRGNAEAHIERENRLTAMQRAARELILAVQSAFPDYLRDFISVDDFSVDDPIINPTGINRLRVTIAVPNFAPIRVFLGQALGYWRVGSFDGSYIVPTIYGSVLFTPTWDYKNGFHTSDLDVALAAAQARGQEFGKLSTLHQQRPEPHYEDVP